MGSKEEILSLIFDAIYNINKKECMNSYDYILDKFIKNNQHDCIVPWLEARHINNFTVIPNSIKRIFSSIDDTNLPKFFKFCVEKYKKSCKEIYNCVIENCTHDIQDKVKMLIFKEYGLEKIKEILNENDMIDFIEKMKDLIDEKQYNIYKIKSDKMTEDEIVNIIKTMQLNTNDCQELLQFFSKKEPISKKTIDAINDQLQGIVLVEK